MINIPKALHIGGIIFGFAAGVAAVVAAIVLKQVAYGVWAGVFLIGGTIALVSGATARPDGSIKPPRIGAKYQGIPDTAMYIIMGLFVIGVIVTFIFPPWR